MATARQKLWVLLFMAFIIDVSLIYAAGPAPSTQITGTWLYLWWHGPASIKKPDGTTVTRLMYIPESYREAGDQKSESYLRFRADGTGTFFKRYLILKNNGAKAIVVTKDRDGKWVEGDRLDFRADFKWRITADKITVQMSIGPTGLNKKGRYRFTFNPLPTRPAPRELARRLRLKDELIVYRFGQFLKVGEGPEQELLRRYGIL